ncbi:hypothetical protein BaRGS_00022436 [Batillaria attramentaria]|uniref:Uncharacterized protein n=1 Tax=Batillaria attramentaria TaxID=370345 RepID=A0ABD0KGD2_9CAEN
MKTQDFMATHRERGRITLTARSVTVFSFNAADVKSKAVKNNAFLISIAAYALKAGTIQSEKERLTRFDCPGDSA